MFFCLPKLQVLDGIPKLPEDSVPPSSPAASRLCTILWHRNSKTWSQDLNPMYCTVRVNCESCINALVYSCKLSNVLFWADKSTLFIKAIFVPVLHIYTFHLLKINLLWLKTAAAKIYIEKRLLSKHGWLHIEWIIVLPLYCIYQVPVCLLHVIRAICLLNDQPTLGFVKFTLCLEGCFDRRVRSWVVLLDAWLVWRKGTEIKSDTVMWHCG